MKKIGIITLNGYFNFGNRLQNYALTKILEEKGNIVNTIWSGEEANLKSRIKMFFILFFPYNQRWKRERIFYKFSKNNMNKVYLNAKRIKKYDIFVAGSDQVWNYESVKNNINYLIPFSKNQRLISYAASMGNSNFPEQYVKLYNKYLKRYDYISVREETAKNILENKVKLKNIEVVLDPTLLLDANHWEKIEEEPKKMMKDKYIFCYFLGDIEENIKEAINEYAQKKNLRIINILDKNCALYNSGPQHFLYLIHNASLICTDSFHSSVFSFLYDKPFIVFKRTGEQNKMYSRINDFIKKFRLNDREFSGYYIDETNIKHDYSEAYKILEKEREKSIKFLKKSLDIKDSEL